MGPLREFQWIFPFLFYLMLKNFSSSYFFFCRTEGPSKASEASFVLQASHQPPQAASVRVVLKLKEFFEKYSNLEIKIEINNQSNSEEYYLNCTHFDILNDIFEREKSNFAHLYSTLGQKSTFAFLAKFTLSKSHFF